MSREAIFDFLSVTISAALVIGVLFLIFRDDGDGFSASSLSAEEVYFQAGESLTEIGGVLHITYETVTTGPTGQTASGQQWIDVANQQVRTEVEYTPQGSLSTLTNPTEYYERRNNGVAAVGPALNRVCFGAGVPVSEMLGCPAAGGQRSVEEGRLAGRNVIVLIESGTRQEGGQALAFTYRLYLDSGSYIPVEAQSEGTLADGQAYTSRTTYQVAELEPSALAADFFQPASVGFTGADPEQAIRNPGDLPVYWLGPTWEMPGVGGFVLASTAAEPDRGNPHKYTLTYVRVGEPQTPPFLVLQIFHRDLWEQSGHDPLEASFFGDTVVFYTEVLPEDEDGRLLTPAIFDALKASVQPYQPEPNATGLLPTAEPLPEQTATPPPAATATPAPSGSTQQQPPTATPEPPAPPPPAATNTPFIPSTPVPGATPTPTPIVPFEDEPTSTPVPPTSTSVPPTSTPVPPPATNTPEPPTATPTDVPTATPEPPTATPTP